MKDLRMTDRNSATTNISLIIIKSEFFFDGQKLGSESFVNFTKIHLIKGESSGFQGHVSGGDWSDSHNFGVTASASKSNDTGKRFQVVSSIKINRWKNQIILIDPHAVAIWNFR